MGLIIIGLVATRIISTRDPKNDVSVVPVQVNFSAPDLKLSTISGEEVSISDFQQDIVLINNWATWCPPCRDEMPTLEKYYKEHHDKGFTLLGIDAGDPIDEVAKFVKEYKLTFTILLDPGNKSLTAFRNDSLPSSYVIDHTGNVVLAWTGPINKAMLEKFVTPLLEK